MVIRYAHHYPKSLHAGVEILDRVLMGVNTNGAQSASRMSAEVAIEAAVKW